MDAVELPLPAEVMVSNLLAAEARVSSTLAANVSVLRSISATAASTGDVLNPVTTSDQSSISRIKVADVEFPMLQSLSLSCDREECSKPVGCKDANIPLLSLPKCTDLHCRSGKVPSTSSPCSKRPRTHQRENSMGVTRKDVDNAIPRKSKCNMTKSTSAETSRVIRQKHNQDGRRSDKRSLKATMKIKLDSFMSKTGFGSSDSTNGGNNILGMYGLKLTNHDVTKLVDEPSLSELLDGSYKCSNLRRDKGKKVADTNESIIASVNKACSILLRHSPAESRSNAELDSTYSRTQPCHLNSSSSESNCNNRDNCIAELASSSKDSCIPVALTSMIDPPLLQPKEILERLALPPTNDLDSLLRDASVPAIPLPANGMHSGRQTSQEARLPPCTWSFSHGGPSKGNIDSGKMFTNRNTCPTRWVRLDNYCSLRGNATNCFSDLMSCDHHAEGPSEELKIDGKVEKEHPATSTSHDLDKNFSKRGPNVVTKYNSLELGGCLNSTDSHPGFQFKERIFLGKQEAEGSMNNHGNESISMDPLYNLLDQENPNICTEIKQIERTMHSDTEHISFYSPSICAVSGSNQSLWHPPSPGSSKQVLMSPRLLAAAQILCELASHSGLMGKQEEKLRWPKKPSQKTMKARKLRSSIGKAEELSVTAKTLSKPGDAGETTGHIPSQRHKFSGEKKKNHTTMEDVHQGSIKCPVSSVGRYSGSSEKDVNASSKQWNVDPIKLVGLMASPSKAEKASGSLHLHKSRKAVFMAPTVNHGKDGSRGRSSRE